MVKKRQRYGAKNAGSKVCVQQDRLYHYGLLDPLTLLILLISLILFNQFLGVSSWQMNIKKDYTY